MKRYDQAWKTIIYPEQMPYDVKDLGPFIFKLDNNIDVKRVDFAVKNIRNENIKGSLFYNPKKLNRVKNQCVVFCNSRNGNRLQGKEHLFEVIKNYHYCIFDYSGSGHSDGKFCTLGQYEKDDIHAVLQFIKEKYFMNRILLWGRSMGAVSAVLYYDSYEKQKILKERMISGMVLDSPYISSKEVVSELCLKELDYSDSKKNQQLP